jgi:hypothetical protein
MVGVIPSGWRLSSTRIRYSNALWLQTFILSLAYVSRYSFYRCLAYIFSSPVINSCLLWSPRCPTSASASSSPWRSIGNARRNLKALISSLRSLSMIYGSSWRHAGYNYPDRRTTASGIENVILQLQRRSASNLVTNDGQLSAASENQMASKRKHTCQECDQAFSSMSLLNDHIKVHHEKICECFMAAVFERNSMKVSIHMPRYWL